MGLTNGSTEPGSEHDKYGFIIPAFAMIGLGLGFFVGHVGTGALVGVGLGFLVSGLLLFVGRSQNEGARRGGANVLLPIGAFLIFIGISIALAPAVLWPYVVPGFFVLLGLWSLIGGLRRIS